MLCWKKPGVAELADALDSKSSGTWYRVGSTPSSGTNSFSRLTRHLFFGVRIPQNFRCWYWCGSRPLPSIGLDVDRLIGFFGQGQRLSREDISKAPAHILFLAELIARRQTLNIRSYAAVLEFFAAREYDARDADFKAADGGSLIDLLSGLCGQALPVEPL